MRHTLTAVAFLFLLFTYWQINDASQYNNHDNWFWIILYVTASALTLVHSRWPLPRWALTSVVGFSIGGALFRMQDDVGNFDFGAIFRATAVPSQMNASTQAPNEIGGLLVVAAWFLFLAVASHSPRPDTAPGSGGASA